MRFFLFGGSAFVDGDVLRRLLVATHEFITSARSSAAVVAGVPARCVRVWAEARVVSEREPAGLRSLDSLRGGCADLRGWAA